MARVPLPINGPDYTNREKALSSQVTKNLWVELNPESRAIAASHHTPGLKPFGATDGADRGIHEMGNIWYGVHGTDLYSMDDQGRHRIFGTIAGTDRCVFADDGTQLIITTGDTPYVYTIADGLQAITDPDLVKPVSVGYLNSQFIFDQNSGTFGEFVTSEVTTTISVDALDFAQAETHPDDILRVFVFGQLVYFFGSHSFEPWYNTGVDRPPFERIQGGVRAYGIAGTHAITATSEHIYFLDHKRVPRRFSSGSSPSVQSIGRPPLGIELAGYSRIDDCICFNYIQDHQNFIVFTFPEADRTWVYHEQGNYWFQWSYGVDGARSRASSAIYIYGANYVSDHSDGNLYELSPCWYTDNGQEIQRRRRSAAFHGGLYQAPGKKMFYDNLEIVLAYGPCKATALGAGPQEETPVGGICGVQGDLVQGEILNVGGITYLNNSVNYLTIDPLGVGYTVSDTKVFSFTTAFMRQVPPLTDDIAPLWAFHNSSRRFLEIHMEDTGYLRIRAKDSTADFNDNDIGLILDVTITNNGGSFADSDFHMIAAVIDLSDEDRREIWIDGADITDNTDYVTWTTYIDGTIPLLTGIGVGASACEIGINTLEDGYDYSNKAGDTNQVTALGYSTFDDNCSLVSSSCWDGDGDLRDPQKWEGWYLTQPMFFFGPSWARNTGRSEPSASGTNTEVTAQIFDQDGSPLHHVNQMVNLGSGSKTRAVIGVPLPTPVNVEIELFEPHWKMTGGEDYLRLSRWPEIDWQSWTGSPFDLSTASPPTWFWPEVAAEGDPRLFPELRAGRAVKIVAGTAKSNITIAADPEFFTNAALVLTDGDGNVLDWCYTVRAELFNTGVGGVASSGILTGYAVVGTHIEVPGDGGTYYLVATSNGVDIKVSQWTPTL